MSKRHVKVTRRQVLRGAGGFVLGLPFLPSLVPGRAYAQDATLATQRRFVAMTTNHGGLREYAMFPDEAVLNEEMDLYSGWRIRRGALQRAVVGNDASVSTVLAAPADRLTDQLVSKMNVLWGVDIPFYIGHHQGGYLGNYARNDGASDEARQIQSQPMPTIDQLMAWSDSFYTDLSGVTQRAMLGGPRDGVSWNYSNPATRSGEIEEVRAVLTARELFDQVFPDPQQAPTGDARAPVVDLVLEAYSSLRQSNRRISNEDRQRLDDHMERLAELSRRLNTRNAACQGITAPEDTLDVSENTRLFIEVMATALICGASRIAVYGNFERDFVSFGGDWHADVAHQWMLDEQQLQLQEANRQAFGRVFVELAAALDSVEEQPGQTVLDNTLMTWSQESGEETHVARSIPIVTFGGAGGFLNTGHFCDYRNRSAQLMFFDEERGHPGLSYTQWLATCLQAMGVPRDEWQSIEHNGPAGYGVPMVDTQYASRHVPQVMDNASEVLPLLGA